MSQNTDLHIQALGSPGDSVNPNPGFIINPLPPLLPARGSNPPMPGWALNVSDKIILYLDTGAWSGLKSNNRGSSDATSGAITKVSFSTLGGTSLDYWGGPATSSGPEKDIYSNREKTHQIYLVKGHLGGGEPSSGGSVHIEDVGGAGKYRFQVRVTVEFADDSQTDYYTDPVMMNKPDPVPGSGS